jgi:hypothetical protein
MHERLKYTAILPVDKSNTAPSGGARYKDEASGFN